MVPRFESAAKVRSNGSDESLRYLEPVDWFKCPKNLRTSAKLAGSDRSQRFRGASDNDHFAYEVDLPQKYSNPKFI